MDNQKYIEVLCDYCVKPAKLVMGNVIYPGRHDLHHKHYWHCEPCDAYVGCHENSRRHAPLGRLANKDLRLAKMRVHAALDPIWKDGHMGRKEAYAWFAALMGIAPEECHVGKFDVEQCRLATEKLLNARIRGEIPKSPTQIRASQNKPYYPKQVNRN